jgi:hypothetical protein
VSRPFVCRWPMTKAGESLPFPFGVKTSRVAFMLVLRKQHHGFAPIELQSVTLSFFGASVRERKLVKPGRMRNALARRGLVFAGG